MCIWFLWSKILTQNRHGKATQLEPLLPLEQTDAIRNRRPFYIIRQFIIDGFSAFWSPVWPLCRLIRSSGLNITQRNMLWQTFIYNFFPKRRYIGSLYVRQLHCVIRANSFCVCPVVMLHTRKSIKRLNF